MLPDKPRRQRNRPKKAKDGEQDGPLTKEAFTAQLHRLTERAKAAGLSPIQVMATAYAKQGMVIIEGLLGALENTDSPKTKTKRKKE